MLKIKRHKRLVITTGVILLLIFSFILYFHLATHISVPTNVDVSCLKIKRESINPVFYTWGKSWIKKSNSGLWEMYIEGKPFERGVAIGKLSKELIGIQENAFFYQIRKLVQSDHYLRFLKYLVAWFDRNIDKAINEEYKEEIYGTSFFYPDKYDFIADKYNRVLNYHAAHDIGHALQDYHFIGCTSFSAWGKRTIDHTPIIGRNFDFYVGDEFAANKIICFYNPDKGYKFMMVSWGGMIGAVSGMNEKGLTVTINAAKSNVPKSAATPISIITREILQYASNIDEAYNIAKKYKSFVSECIMIGSSQDNKTAIIEKTPYKTALYSSDSDYIICSNHFQSKEFRTDKMNLENIKESSSLYRYQRVEELLNRYQTLNPEIVAKMLRNTKGLKDEDIGLGNEKSINQLVAHHSVILIPSKRLVWVSTAPYQLGAYVCYDLKKIFSDKILPINSEIRSDSLTIQPDSFLFSEKYLLFKNYKYLLEKLNGIISSKNRMTASQSVIEQFINCNPKSYLVYLTIGNYFNKNNELRRAIEYYNLSLKMVIPTLTERRKIENKLAKLQSNKQ